KQAFAAAGLELEAAHVRDGDAAEMAAALDELEAARIDAFLMLMDPRTMTADAFEQLARFAERHDVVLAVPDASLVVPGKTFSFVPGFWDLGAYAGTLVRRIVEGKVQPSQIGISYPSHDSMDRLIARPMVRDYHELLPAGATTAVRIAGDE